MEWVPWLSLALLLAAALALDLRVFHRETRASSIGEALSWTLGWVLIALAFNVAVYFAYEGHWFGLGEADNALTGESAALQFFTAYLVQK